MRKFNYPSKFKQAEEFFFGGHKLLKVAKTMILLVWVDSFLWQSRTIGNQCMSSIQSQFFFHASSKKGLILQIFRRTHSKLAHLKFYTSYIQIRFLTVLSTFFLVVHILVHSPLSTAVNLLDKSDQFLLSILLIVNPPSHLCVLPTSERYILEFK